MRIDHFGGTEESQDVTALEAVLMRRYGDGNEFWLAGETRYPALTIKVDGGLASLHYFPEDRHPGYRSVGRMDELEEGGSRTFFGSREGVPPTAAEKEDVPNEFIVPFSVALQAAREFLADRTMPPSIEWFEL